MRGSWFLCVLVGGCAAAPGAPPAPDRIREELARSGGTVVLVTLRQPAGKARDALAPARLDAVARQNRAFAASLDGSHARARRTFGTFAGGIVWVDADGYQALTARPEVLAVEPDLPVTGHDLQSIPLIRANLTQAAGAKGAGVAVAVLDTGMRTTHQDLRDAVLGPGQHFLDQGVTVGAGAEDDQGHGSNVSGIIASRGAVAGNGPGVAPKARIVPVKVLDNQERGWTTDWVAGLDWIVTNQNTFGTPIRVINMSLGTDTRSANCPCDSDNQTAMKMVLDRARAAGMLVTASSGNAGDTAKLPYPACFSTVIAVGATYDADIGRQPQGGTYQTAFGSSWPACFDTTAARTVTCFTNRNACVALVAPGAAITSDGFASDTALITFFGTSQAAPHVAGMAAVIWGAHPSLTVDQVEHSLLTSTTSVPDPTLAQSYAFLDAVDSLAAAECEDGCNAQSLCEVAGCNAAGICQHTPMTPGTPCGDATCSNGTRTDPICNASGACAQETTACGAYQCNAAGDDCLASCVLQTDCAGGYTCQQRSCVAAAGDGGGCQTARGAPPWAALALLALLVIKKRRWSR